MKVYRISSIRRSGYYYFRCMFMCGYYSRAAYISLESPPTPTMARWRYVRTIQWRLSDTVSSKRSLSVLLPAVETSRTTRKALVLARWNYSPTWACAAYNSTSVKEFTAWPFALVKTYISIKCPWIHRSPLNDSSSEVRRYCQSNKVTHTEHKQQRNFHSWRLKPRAREFFVSADLGEREWVTH